MPLIMARPRTLTLPPGCDFLTASHGYAAERASHQMALALLLTMLRSCLHSEPRTDVTDARCLVLIHMACFGKA